MTYNLHRIKCLALIYQVCIGSKVITSVLWPLLSNPDKNGRFDSNQMFLEALSLSAVKLVLGLPLEHGCFIALAARTKSCKWNFFVQLGNRIATHFRNASGFETNSSQTKHVTSCTWLTKVTEAAVPWVTYGANPVKIGGSIAEFVHVSLT